MTDTTPTAWTLAVDFGTSFTVAAVRLEGRAPEAIEMGGERRMPSVILVDERGVQVGRVAEDLSATRPGQTVRAPKRRLGDPSPVVLGGHPYQVVDLVAALLRHVYDEAVRHQGSPPTAVRLTHPATWSRPRLARLLEAAAKAGLPDAALIAEPVAAALAYASDVAVPDGANVAVYDLGGGTFDTTVLRAERGSFAVVGRPGGDANLGGELFDEMLMNVIGERLDPEVCEHLQVSDDLAWRQAFAALRSEVRRAKESLTAAPYAELLLPLPGGLVNQRLTRDELDQLVTPYIDESVRLLIQCVRDAGLDPQSLAAVYLVGGASRMPLIERMLSAALPGVPISRRGDPKTAVALGATRAEPSGSVVDLQAAGGRTTLDSDAGRAAAGIGSEQDRGAVGPSAADARTPWSAAPLLAPPILPPSIAPPAIGGPPSMSAPPAAGSPSISAPSAAEAPAWPLDQQPTAFEGTVVERGPGTVVDSSATPGRPAPPPFTPPPLGPSQPAVGPSRGRRGLVAAVAAAVVLLVVAGVAVAVTRGGDDKTAAPTTAPPATASPVVGPSPTLGTLATPTTPGSSTPPSGAPATSAPSSPTTARTATPPTAAPTTPAPPTTAPGTASLTPDQLKAAVLSLAEVNDTTARDDWREDVFQPSGPLCGLPATPDAQDEVHTVVSRGSGASYVGITMSSFTYATPADLAAGYDSLATAARTCPDPKLLVNGVAFALSFNTPVEGTVPLVDRSLAFTYTAKAPGVPVIQSFYAVLTKGRSGVAIEYTVIARSLDQTDLDVTQKMLTLMTLRLISNVA